MKFTSALIPIIAAAAVNAATSTVEFVARSTDAAIDGLGLYSIHEGAAINYVFLGTNSETYNFTSETGVLSHTYPTATLDIVQTWGISDFEGAFPGLEVSVITSYDFYSIDSDGFLLRNGTANWFVCHNTNDPYQYSKTQWEVGFFSSGTADAGCEPIQIQKKGAASTVVSSASTEAASTTTASNHTTITTVTSIATKTSSSTETTAPATKSLNAADALNPVGGAAIAALAYWLL